MTSNAGVREISRDSRLGFGVGTGIMNQEEVASLALSELRRLFNPEFINRIDDVVVFHPLNIQQVESILDIQLNELALRLAEQGYSIKILPTAKRILVEKGWDPKYGGRPLRRTVQRELEDPLSMLILEQGITGTIFLAEGRHGKIEIKSSVLEPDSLREETHDYRTLSQNR
jgi:ATP-dependent Clp protease ATP-binding subunit ClpC